VGDQPRFPSDDHEPDTEGVRIIGADEAAEAVERGDVVQRRPQDAPKFGDRPSQPEGPRPTLRFPLSDAADPSDIERPKPAPRAAAGERPDKRSLFSVEGQTGDEAPGDEAPGDEPRAPTDEPETPDGTRIAPGRPTRTRPAR
jgi:hypothetical protein